MPTDFSKYGSPASTVTPTGTSDFGKYGTPAGKGGVSTPADVINTKKSVGGFVSNILKSGGSVISSTASAVAHPVATVQGLSKIASGALEKGVVAVANKVKPGTFNNKPSQNEQAFNAAVDFYKNRYGGVDKIKETIYNDPVGFALDLSAVLTGGGAAVTKAGRVLDAASVVKTGTRLAKAGQMVDPIAGVLKVAGKGTEALTAGRKIAPFGSKVDQAVLDAATRRGVDLPASSISRSPAVALTETLAGKGFFGGKMVDKIEQAGVKLNKIADEAVAAAGGTTDVTVIGKNISKSFKGFKDAFTKMKNELYDAAVLPTGTAKRVAIPVKASRTQSFLNEVISGKKAAASITGGAEDLNFFNTLKKNLVKKVEASGVREAMKEIDGMIDYGKPMAVGNNATLMKIRQLLGEDLDVAIKAKRPDLAAAIDKANAFYRQGVEKINSPFGKKISRFKNQSDKIVSSIINPSTSVEDIPRIFEVVGEKNIPDIQAFVLDDIFTKARSAGTGDFTPMGIAQQINRYGEDKLRAILTPEQFKVTKDLEALSRAMGRGAKVSQGSQTAFIGRIGVELGLAFGGNIPLAVKALASDLFTSYLVSTKTGQKLLTSGIDLTGATGQAIQRGGARITGKTALPFQAIRAGQLPQGQ